MNQVERVEREFRKLFNEQPLFVRSPGRINLIGEHTDYNLGYVLPASIDKAIYFAISPREDEQCRLYALDMNDEHSFTLGKLELSEKGWPNYLMGVVDQFLRSGQAVKGFNCVFAGDIPIGAGLSSSAAIEGGLAFGLNRIFALGMDKLSLVMLAQKAENEFVGVRCGVMDQFVNMFGENAKALEIDCRTLDYKTIPFDSAKLKIVLCETEMKRSLAASAYNQRRKECEIGVEILQRENPAVRSLRDASMGMLELHRDKFDSVTYRRCKYVVQEITRVHAACTALERGDFRAFGQYLYESHEGLRDDYEVSSQDLDLLVECAASIEGVFGSRMMSAGFGGCTISVIEDGAVEGFDTLIRTRFKQKSNSSINVHVTSIQSGTSIISGVPTYA